MCSVAVFGITCLLVCFVLQVPSRHDYRMQLFDCCDVHFGCAFKYFVVIDAELFHTLQSVVCVDCATMSDENGNQFNVVLMGETFDQLLVLLLAMEQLVVVVCASASFQFYQEEGGFVGARFWGD